SRIPTQTRWVLSVSAEDLCPRITRSDLGTGIQRKQMVGWRASCFCGCTQPPLQRSPVRSARFWRIITASRAPRPLLLVVCRHVFELLAVLVSSFSCYRAGLAIGCYDNAPVGGCLVTFLNGELQRLCVNLLVRAHI